MVLTRPILLSFLPTILQLAGTVDVLPTVLTIAGAKIPSDRPIDGVDMSPILFESGKVSEMEIPVI